MTPPMHRRLRRTSSALIAGGLAITGTVLGLGPGHGSASSHREAPLLLNDPEVDNTDTYAFVSLDNPENVTLIANWVPFEEPAGGPNFYKFNDDAQYDINIDNNGDAVADIVYRWEFDTTVRNDRDIQLATGVIDGLQDENLNIFQTYTLKEIRGDQETVLLEKAPVVPSYVGDASMPNYASLRDEGIVPLPEGQGKSFAGQADDPFFLDLRVFDLLYGGDLSEVGYDTLNGFNTNSVALEVPTDEVAAGNDTGANPIIGVWSTTQRPASLSFEAGAETASGDMIQVSRLGNPLVNEVVIALKDKDKFNSSEPAGDAQFLDYVQNPIVPPVIEKIYGIKAPPTPRKDLVQVFLTGVPDLNMPENVTPSEQLRLNMSIPPASDPDRLGVLGGDKAGFPNGRRLSDDVVDIELQVLVGELVNPDNASDLGDGVNNNDQAFGSTFPFLALPTPGSKAAPHNPIGSGGTPATEGAAGGSSSTASGSGSVPSGGVAAGFGGLAEDGSPVVPITLGLVGLALVGSGLVLRKRAA